MYSLGINGIRVELDVDIFIGSGSYSNKILERNSTRFDQYRPSE
jgi:hypothetical protein